MSKSRVTPVGRASFPHLSKPNQYGKYALTILLPKDNPKVQEFVKWLKDTVKSEALGVAGEQGLNAAMADFQAFKDGDNITAFKTYRAEYAAHWVLSAGKKADFGKPTVVNRHKQPIDPSEVYAGCDVMAFIDVFGYKYAAKKSVSIGLQHVMKVNDNAAFTAAGVPVDSAFEDVDLPDESLDDGVNDGSENPFLSDDINAAGVDTKETSTDPFSGV
jgi:hypothetical protein